MQIGLPGSVGKGGGGQAWLGGLLDLVLGCNRVGLGHFPRSPGISRNVRQELSQGDVENGFRPSEGSLGIRAPDAAQGKLSLVKPWFDEHPLSLT